jgi:hypothetical protein
MGDAAAHRTFIMGSLNSGALLDAALTAAETAAAAAAADAAAAAAAQAAKERAAVAAYGLAQQENARKEAAAAEAAAAANAAAAAAAAAAQPEGSWDCNSCRSANPPSNPVCFLCKRGQRPRRCPACTVNVFDAAAKNCAVCGTALAGPAAAGAHAHAAAPPPPMKQQRVDHASGGGRDWQCMSCLNVMRGADAALGTCSFCRCQRMV